MTVSVRGLRAQEMSGKPADKMKARWHIPASGSGWAVSHITVVLNQAHQRLCFSIPNPTARQLQVQCLVWHLLKVKLKMTYLLEKSNIQNKTYLNQNTATEPSFHKGLGHPTGCICCWSVHLCIVFSRKGTTSVGSPATVSIHNDLSTSNTSITLIQ